MSSDRWPHEPKEESPEERWGDPEHDLPNVPEVDVPEVAIPEVDASDVDPEVSRFFWAAVVLANVGLAGVTIGPMLVFFRGQWTVGLALVAVGLLAFARTYSIHRRFQNRDRGGDESADQDAETGATSAGDGALDTPASERRD